MLLVIKNLREIAECFRDGTALPEELALWLERSLREFLEHRCNSVDEALGLRFAKGGVPWWLEEGMRIRDAALRTLAERFFPDATTSARAAQVFVLSERFAAANWPRDAQRVEMPAHYDGTPKQYLWHAFQSGAQMPLGERRLRTILAGATFAPTGIGANRDPSGNGAASARAGPSTAPPRPDPARGRPFARVQNRA